MRKLLTIMSILTLLGAYFSYKTGQEAGATISLLILGGGILVVALIGDRP